MIISIEDKHCTMNWIARYFKNPLLLSLIVCPSWLAREKNPYIATVPSPILYGMYTSIPYRRNHSPFIFFWSIRSSMLLRNQGLWLNFFPAYRASSGKTCVSYSNIPFLLTRDFSGFVSFPYYHPMPPHSYPLIFSSDTLRLYILMVTVHGSSEETLDF